MLKKKKIILLSVAAFFVVIIAVLLFNFYPMLVMKPIATGIIENTDILAIKNMSNVYVLSSGEGYILIDAGSNAKNLEKVLQQENISIESVTHIFLTHSDGDHVAAVTLFPNAAVYMSEDELQMINGEITQGKNNRKSILNDFGLDNIVLLQDKQEIFIGEHTIKCVKMAGHTPGSMLYVVDEEYLFSGDCFRVSSNKILTHPFTRDEKLAKESINRLYDMIRGTKYTFTAHYGYFESNSLTID
jgi:glyoxylase-like metal-dependent hydrolase (beta-lactamase superfamily II)